VALHLAVLFGVALLIAAHRYYMHHVLDRWQISGDSFFIRRMAYTNLPVSPPYCWRPLVPALARMFGFSLVSYTSAFATVLAIYLYAGATWAGVACGLMFVGNNHMFSFTFKNPDYGDGVGQLLMVLSLWAMASHHPAVWLLLLLCGFCRETISVSLATVALFWHPVYVVPLALSTFVAYFTRLEDKENRHPLIEPTVRGTIDRWIKHKGVGASHYAHVLQPLRGAAIAVPFVWDQVGDFARLGLLGCIPVWLLSLPASGQSRIMCYAWFFFIPFLVELPAEWLWFFTIVAWFWPVDIRAFDEAGDVKFGYAR
jgi:hypothetical protein